MNDRYPDASREEVAREDVCIICRENMRAWTQPAPAENPPNANAQPAPASTAPDERTRPKKLPCGHILHFACLRSWLERQQNCPTCRRPVLVAESTASPAGPNAPNPIAGAAPAANQQQAAHPAHPAGNAPAVHQNVFNFGPFRLAFGARIGRGVPPQINNNPAAPHQPQIPGELQGIGNSFGFFGQPQAQPQTNARFTPLNVSAQLHQIEQQLMREVNSLRAQSDQLYLVRALQGELARLRIQQAQGNQIPMMNGSAITNQQRPLNITGQSLQPMVIPPGGPNQPFSMPQAFASGQQQQSMGSGHPDLPSGLTLPQGWSVLPLQRVASASSNANDASTVTSHNQQVPPSQAPVISTETQASTSHGVDTTASGLQQSGNPAIITPTSSVPLEATTTQSAPSPVNETTDTSHSSDLPPGDIPQWGSVPLPPSNDSEDNTPAKAEPGSTSVNGTANHLHEASNAGSSSQERREAKGKGKAVTIEDSTDDLD